MRKICFFVTVLGICLFSLLPVTIAAKNSEPVLKVLVGSGTTVNIAVSGEYEILDGEKKKLISKEKTPSVVTIRGAELFLRNKALKVNSLEVRPKGNAVITVNGKKYRGGLLLKKGSAISIINLVGLEDYIKGVVPEEMSESWPVEALKAQAVAARTFALYTKDEEKHDGYDLCSSTHCQAYGGIASEAAVVNNAVDATRGEVLNYNGKIIYAAFHSDSGGFTANSEEVWGGKQPYLRSVKDDTAGAPHNKWEEDYTIGEVESLLRDNGYYVGELKEIILTPLQLGKGRTADRYDSGRVQYVKFKGTKGIVTLTGNTMRSVFDLSSTLFDVRLSSEKKWNSIHNLKKNSKDKVIFVGHGWGHGLGMSQWGAKIMSVKKDYKTILKHFYTKVEIRKLY